MSVALRNRRVAIYDYSNTGTGGLVEHTYTKHLSAAADGNWWASRGVPTGREVLMAAQAEHIADAVFGFASDVPLDVNGGLKDVITGEQFRIEALLPRLPGVDEQQVLAVFNSDAVFNDVGG